MGLKSIPHFFDKNLQRHLLIKEFLHETDLSPNKKVI